MLSAKTPRATGIQSVARDNRETPLVKVVGYPDGPKMFVLELCCGTALFGIDPVE